MHRNTLLFVSSLAVLAALLVGVHIGRNLPRTLVTTALPTPQVLPSPTAAFLTYNDKACRLTLQYPSNLQILESTNSGSMLADPNNTSDTVLIYCVHDIPRIPLPKEKITTMKLFTENGSTVSAKIYHDASAKDGTAIDKLIFTHPYSGGDVLIAGFGPVYNQILTTLKIQ